MLPSSVVEQLQHQQRNSNNNYYNKLVCVGNYKFTGKRLGKGNFAKVEEAVHNIVNKKVAIKMMDITSIKDDYVIKNLYREAKIMSKLSHPCIMTLYQTMQYGNVYYLIVELLAGGDLCNFVKNQRNGKLDERTTRIYARQLVSAIAYMHNLGIVHRDLKMENVMLNSLQTHVKIVDFGLSNVFTVENPLRTHCGSPEYAAPELFVEGKHYGPEVDLWSLGVILYGMIVGQLPFVSKREENVTSQQRRKKLVEQINRGVSTIQKKSLVVYSAEIRNVIAKLLATDVTKRINVKELIIHPWLTEKGKKMIRTNPFGKVDENLQSKVYKELALMLRLDEVNIKNAITCDPYGNVGGMYNILRYRCIKRVLEGDGITKRVTSVNMETSPRNKPDVRPSTVRATPTNTLNNKKRSDNVCKSAPQRTTKIPLLKNAKIIVKKEEITHESIARLYVENDEEMINLRDILTSRSSRNKIQTKQPQRKIQASPKPLQVVAHAIRLTPRDEDLLIKKSSKSYPLRPPVPRSAPMCTKKRQTTKVTREEPEQTRQLNKPATAKTPDIRAKLTARPETVNNHSRNVLLSKESTRTKEDFKKFSPWMKTREAGGDNTINLQNRPVKKHLINEPIARSIAGYVNNVQGNLTSLKWMKSAK